ncbi:hypothetical protein [Embleya sp. NBC_00896]|uniref:hypothetical protein n=1 Tax=Embleya sp. NBC_00896 TaxID=2975961 RepID=UPI003868665B|nr:hypothetical protein OG928_29600 [Embleya sp. NBC_00896]
MVALVGAADPYRQTREFRATVKCERGDDCFGSEAGSIAGRRTYTTTSTDSEGYTTTTTHYEVTWQRADGSRQGREVSGNFYRKAQEGEPVTLRLWRDEVVGVEVMGTAEWFLPKSATMLVFWLYLAYFGLGVLLWGMLFGWWDGFFMLCFRTVSWMFTSAVPVQIATDALAYGLNTESAPIGAIVFGVFFTGIAAGMVFSTLRHSWR